MPVRSEGGDGVASPASAAGSWGPGRALRVPLGWIPVAAVVMVALAVLAYIWGFSRGRHDARLEAGRVLEASMASRSVLDPLAGDVSGGASGRTGSGEGRGAAPEADARGASGTGGTGGAEIVSGGGDPRRPGFNYFVLAHATPDTAPELAAFCRGRGLEARVVQDHNGVARKVVVVPGYVDGERRSDRVEALERRIVEVGLAWKSHRRGNADFSGYYPELHRGPDDGG